MNVLIVPSWYEARPGAQLGSFFREQAMALKAMGCNVIIADVTFQSMHSLKGKKVFGVQKKDDEGLLTYSYLIPSFGLMRMPKIGARVYTRNLEKLICSIVNDGHKIDVIHAHSFYFAGVAATRLGKKHYIPVIVTEHSSTIISRSLISKRIELLKETVLNCDEFICVGNGLKKAVIEYTQTNKMISVIPNMVDERFTYKEEKRADTFHFVSVGNLIQSKRFDLTIRAFASAFKGEKRIMLTIIGDGVLKEELESLAKELGVAEQVFFMGRLERKGVVREMQKSDVFVLASDYETFGVVYIEALACGVPVIGTRNGGADDIVDGTNGVLIDTNNEQQLADAMDYLHKNITRYDEKEIAEKCKEKYGKNAICSKIIDKYRIIMMSRMKI